jgi:hypothetical protein
MLQEFTPKEIAVQVIGRNALIDCVHDARNDKHGSIRREVSAQFTCVDLMTGASVVCVARRRGRQVAVVAPHRERSAVNHRQKNEIIATITIFPNSNYIKCSTGTVYYYTHK